MISRMMLMRQPRNHIRDYFHLAPRESSRPRRPQHHDASGGSTEELLSTHQTCTSTTKMRTNTLGETSKPFDFFGPRIFSFSSTRITTIFLPFPGSGLLSFARSGLDDFVSASPYLRNRNSFFVDAVTTSSAPVMSSHADSHHAFCLSPAVGCFDFDDL